MTLIHGWGQHGGVWGRLLAHWPGLPVCRLELPGHGDEPPAAFELDALVDGLARRCPPQGTVIGWSLGGLLALRWAQRYPQVVKRLVLFSTTPCFGEVPQDFIDQVAAAPALALQRFADLMAQGEADERGVRRALRDQLARKAVPTAETLLDGLRLLAGTDLRDSLRQNPPTQPVLLIHGERDRVTPIVAARRLADMLPGARLLALPDCGHAPMVSRAAEAAVAIAGFLDDA